MRLYYDNLRNLNCFKLHLLFLTHYVRFQALTGFKFKFAFRVPKSVHENGLKNHYKDPQYICMCCARNEIKFQRSMR